MLILPRRLALRTLLEVRARSPKLYKRGSTRFVVTRLALQRRMRSVETCSPHTQAKLLPIYRDAIALLTR